MIPAVGARTPHVGGNPVVQRAERDAVTALRKFPRPRVAREIGGAWSVTLPSNGRYRLISEHPDWPSAIEFAQVFARTYALK